MVDLNEIVKAAQQTTAERYKELLKQVMVLAEEHSPETYPAFRAAVLELVQRSRA